MLNLSYVPHITDALDHGVECNENQEKLFENDCVEPENINNNKINGNLKESLQLSNIKENAHGPVKHTCQFCSKVFTRKFNLKLHV